MPSLKEQIKKVMLDHLKSKGYPNMSTDSILQECRPMWIKIEEAGLKQRGWTFQQFGQIAADASLFAQIRSSWGQW